MTLPAYRGDAVNGFDFTPSRARPDPRRLLQRYNTSASTLNLVRAFTQGGFADLRQVHAWNQDFVRDSPAGARYEQLAGEIDRAMAFMQAVRRRPGGVQHASTSTPATRRCCSTTSAR